MKIVEEACMITIAFTKPNLLAIGGPARVATAMTMLTTPRIGPLTVSGIPYWSLNHAVIKGTTMPAPTAIIALLKTYLATIPIERRL